MYLKAHTLDDLLRKVLAQLLVSKNRISPSRGDATESIAALLQITNPRARLSLSETKGKLTSCLGELLWYLAKSNDLEFIRYYLSRYKEESDDGVTVHGAYGPRLFGMRRQNQVKNVVSLLRKKRDSRRAVIQLFDAADLTHEYKDIPCTCTIQFMIRENRLHMFTSMRSNDAFIGLPHDVFAFTMIQEIFARTLGVGLGTYNHAVGSLHLYERDRKGAKRYLKEGWQSTAPMPAMPEGNPWPSIQKLLSAESKIRTGRQIEINKLNLAPYWKNILRILLIFSHFQKKNATEIDFLKGEMSVRSYDFYIEDLKAKLRKKNSVSTKN